MVKTKELYFLYRASSRNRDFKCPCTERLVEIWRHAKK